MNLKIRWAVAIALLHCTFANARSAYQWQVVAVFQSVPVLAGENGDSVGASRVKIFRDGDSGSVMATENGVCSMIYFTNANKGIDDASALGCASWLNYDIPTFNAEGFNFPVRLGPGADGDWSRDIQSINGGFALTVRFVKRTPDPDLIQTLEKRIPLTPDF